MKAVEPQAREIGMIVASPQNGMIRLSVIVDGQTELFVISRTAAASAAGRIAEALAKSA